MASSAMHLAAYRQFALVPQHGFEFSGLTDQAQPRFVPALFERCEHRAYTQAADLFVI